jgi:hypothetical protein
MSTRALARHADEQVELVINLKTAKALGLSFCRVVGRYLERKC